MPRIPASVGLVPNGAAVAYGLTVNDKCRFYFRPGPKRLLRNDQLPPNHFNFLKHAIPRHSGNALGVGVILWPRE
jgi:hypothetical protein